MNANHCRHRGPRATFWLSIPGVLGVLFAPAALAHWTAPEQIVAGLKQDAVLQDKAGVFDVYRDRRLLVIQVLRARWDTLPGDIRVKLASEWRDTWRHNVPGGIVAILDATNDQNLVHYDAHGSPHLIEPVPPTP